PTRRSSDLPTHRLRCVGGASPEPSSRQGPAPPAPYSYRVDRISRQRGVVRSFLGAGRQAGRRRRPLGRAGFQGMGSTGGKLGFGERLRRLFGPRDRLVFGGNRARRLEEPRESVSGARFGLVGLTDLREHLGERWPELAERVHGLAQTVISRHLTRGDVFDAHGEDGYVVLFAQLS